jgi:hypothetical protein
MDAILVRRFFGPVDAGNYSAAVTLGKIIQFFPVAIIMVLFPKAAQRQAAHRDTTRVLVPAMLIVALVCGSIALLYALFPGADCAPDVRAGVSGGWVGSGTGRSWRCSCSRWPMSGLTFTCLPNGPGLST